MTVAITRLDLSAADLREVAAPMLDYAANSTWWSFDKVRGAFSGAGKDVVDIAH